MNQTNCKATPFTRPNEVFLKSFLGEDVVATTIASENICSGIEMYYADVILNPQSNAADEAAYLHFYPVADEKYYLQLSFLPERLIADLEVYRVVQIVFTPDFFSQWPTNIITAKQPFRFDRCTEQTFTLTAQLRDLVDFLLKKDEEKLDFIYAIKRQETALAILRFALEAFLIPDEANVLPACSFLTNNTERTKVMDAQRLIMDNLEQPFTIRALSREVGMNECYLKKGFKAMYGKTIHDYQQYQRIEKSKELLMQGKYSVNEVAFKMGFGSPSHFSTTFKRIAGLKPCELLR